MLAKDILDLCMITDTELVHLIPEYVAKRGDKWCVISHTDPDKSFGCYNTKEEAEKRLRQIQYFKYKKE
jgi:hypothetical protein